MWEQLHKLIGYFKELIYFSDDIVNRDTGKVDHVGQKGFFFQLSKSQITQVAGVEELPKVIIQEIKKIIPIGLLVLSMVLLVYLIKSVILRMK